MIRRVVFAASLVAFAAGVFWFVDDRHADVNADLFNYHYFSGYALLHGRFLDDVAPAGLQSFLNPAPDVLAYLLITYLPFPWSAWPIVAIQLTSVLILCRILREMRFEFGSHRLGINEVLALAVCLISPLWWSELGTTFFSGTTAPLVLLALLWLSRAVKQDLELARRRPLVFAGVALGLATGLKMTNGIFAVAAWMTIVLVVLSAQPRALVRTVGPLTLGLVVGFATTAAWNVYLAVHWGSPLYPFYNGIFRSPWFEQSNFRDTRWMFRSIGDFVRFLTDVADVEGTKTTSEIAFADARIPLAIALVAVSTLLATVRAARVGTAATTVRQPASSLLLMFVAISTLLWAVSLAYQRYFIPVELLLGVVIWIACQRIFRNRHVVTVALIAVVGAAGFAVRFPEWGHGPESGIGADYFRLSVPERLRREPADYLVTGFFNSFAFPFLAADNRYLRMDMSATLDPRIRAMLAAGRHPVRLFTNESELPRAHASIARVGYELAGREDECERFASSRDRYVVCELRPVR